MTRDNKHKRMRKVLIALMVIMPVLAYHSVWWTLSPLPSGAYAGIGVLSLLPILLLALPAVGVVLAVVVGVLAAKANIGFLGGAGVVLLALHLCGAAFFLGLFALLAE